MLEAVCFYGFAVPMLLAAVSVIFSRRPMYSVLSLLLVMFCLAGLFVMLHAYVVAALQVLLYAGAVLVLFLFVIMLLNLAPEQLARMRAFTLRGAGTLVALLLFAILLRLFLVSPTSRPSFAAGWTGGTVEDIGRLLFNAYLLPFELTSFLVLAAIIGAVTLGKQETGRTPKR